VALKWYIVHVYSGFENKVKAALEERIASSSDPEKFGEIVVPTEEIVELVKGKRKTSSRKFYPGYITPFRGRGRSNLESDGSRKAKTSTQIFFRVR
jgi:hypothetical protein